MPSIAINAGAQLFNAQLFHRVSTQSIAVAETGFSDPMLFADTLLRLPAELLNADAPRFLASPFLRCPLPTFLCQRSAWICNSGAGQFTAFPPLLGSIQCSAYALLRSAMPTHCSVFHSLCIPELFYAFAIQGWSTAIPGSTKLFQCNSGPCRRVSVFCNSNAQLVVATLSRCSTKPLDAVICTSEAIHSISTQFRCVALLIYAIP